MQGRRGRGEKDGRLGGNEWPRPSSAAMPLYTKSCWRWLEVGRDRRLVLLPELGRGKLLCRYCRSSFFVWSAAHWYQTVRGHLEIEK
ncbi:hypothetical protein LZ31DRAFT_262301 [Colletotrichum somersetense]|nr:hypothetical protein LZ31DRAFT_262301 [Colletotrichum somersetense]